MISPSITSSKGLMMRPDLALYLVTGVCLILLVLLTHWRWSRRTTAPATPNLTRRKRAPTPFAGYMRKPECECCEQEVEFPPQLPGAPPSRMGFTRGRRRYIETTGHFCPHAECAYHGRVDWGNIRANGHPTGRRWRQLVCLSCRRYFLETLGTPFHAKQVDPDQLVWAIAALAEGLGIRAVARVFETDPNTVLGWLVEAAEHLEAFSRYHLHDLHVEQVQMDELFAWLSAVKEGEVTEAEAMKRLARSPHWVWVAMDPVCKLILAVDVGDRTLALAQRLVHQVTQVLAPECAPLFLTDGFREYLTALVTHYGQWIQPERRQGKGRWPKPRWMLQPRLLYAQAVKFYRRRRLVGVKHRIIFGAAATIESILAKRGWKINTSFIERLNLDFRQHVAAIGRRVNTLCKHEAGLRQQLALFHTYHNFVLPHASLRLPLPHATHGIESGKRWRQQTPAMAAGLADHIWSLREVLIFRVPPWPQPLV
jgi:IS1 family transposase/transposase-like protein